MATVVFAAGALEAYVYDIASRKRGDGDARRIDNLPAKDRWKELAGLLGLPYDEDGNIQPQLEKLVRLRREAVHPKSLNPYDLEPDQWQELLRSRPPLSDAHFAVGVLDIMSALARTLDDEWQVRMWLGSSSVDPEIDAAWAALFGVPPAQSSK